MMDIVSDQRLLSLKSFVILGGTGTGKTALGYSILNRARPVYIYRHPKPSLVRALGFEVMHSIEELEDLNDCDVYIDEPQLSFPLDDKKGNTIMAKILSLARQKGIRLIFATSDSRWVTRGLESYVDCWLIKDIETALLKNGSLAKKVIRRNCYISESDFRLPNNKFLFYSRYYPELGGKYEFAKPEFFTEELSKPYR